MVSHLLSLFLAIREIAGAASQLQYRRGGTAAATTLCVSLSSTHAWFFSHLSYLLRAHFFWFRPQPFSAFVLDSWCGMRNSGRGSLLNNFFLALRAVTSLLRTLLGVSRSLQIATRMQPRCSCHRSVGVRQLSEDRRLLARISLDILSGGVHQNELGPASLLVSYWHHRFFEEMWFLR